MVPDTLIVAIAAARKRQAEEAARANDPQTFLRSFAALRNSRAATPPPATGATAALAATDGTEEEDDDAPARLPDIPAVPAATAAPRRKKGRAR